MSSATKPAEVAIPTGADEMRKFLKRAENGDESTLPVLWKMLKDPATVGWFGGNLAYQAELALIRASVGDNLAFREAARPQAAVAAGRPGREGPNPHRAVAGRARCRLLAASAGCRHPHRPGEPLVLTLGRVLPAPDQPRPSTSPCRPQGPGLGPQVGRSRPESGPSPEDVNGSDPGPDWQQERVRTDGRFHRENGTVAAGGTVLTIAPNRTGMARMEPR